MTEHTPVRNRSTGAEDRIGKWPPGLTFFAAILMLIAGTAQFFTGLSAVLGNVPYAFTAGSQLFEFSADRSPSRRHLLTATDAYVPSRPTSWIRWTASLREEAPSLR